MGKRKLKPEFGISSYILMGVCAFLIAADLVTKYLEERFNWNKVIIDDWIEIRSGVHNPGCAFSFLDNNPQIGQPVLITFTFLLIAALIFGFIFIPKRFVVLKLAIAVVIAGAVGNLVDRLMFISSPAYGYVRDWFGLRLIFSMVYCNLADFWIVIGVAIAVVDLLFCNEWAVFPLTKKAKAAQAERKEEAREEDGEENG